MSSQHGRGVAGICIDFDNLLCSERRRIGWSLLRHSADPFLSWILFSLAKESLVYKPFTSVPSITIFRLPFLELKMEQVYQKRQLCRLLDDLSKSNLESTSTTAALEFGFSHDAHDIVARCAGAQFVVTSHLFLKRKIWNIGARPSTRYETNPMATWCGIHRSSSTTFCSIGL